MNIVEISDAIGEILFKCEKIDSLLTAVCSNYLDFSANTLKDDSSIKQANKEYLITSYGIIQALTWLASDIAFEQKQELENLNKELDKVSVETSN